MKIRATRKLLNIARIQGNKDPDPLMDQMPGEWYSSVVSMGVHGKLAIHFLHAPTMITVIIPGKSLPKAIVELPDHVAALLERQGFSGMLPEYQLGTQPGIFSTNSRSMLAYMNQMRYNIEYHLWLQRPVEDIEDIEFGYLFSSKWGRRVYITPKKILSDYLSKAVGQSKQG